MIARKTAVILTVFALATGAEHALAQNAGYAGLRVDIEYLHGDESIPAGHPGRFNIIVRNDGPDASTSTAVHLAWFRSRITGETIGHEFLAYPSQGRCSRSLTPAPDCYLGYIPAGGEVHIDFHGSTDPGKLAWYTLRVWAGSDQAENTLLAELSKGTAVTVLESGGGSLSAGGLLLLVLIALRQIAVGESGRPHGSKLLPRLQLLPNNPGEIFQRKRLGD